MNLDITVLIFTRNERENLSRLLPYLARYIRQFVIIDAMSTDGTKEICEKYGKVYETLPLGYADPCRMYGISKVTTEWIFYLDADEYPSETLLKALPAIIRIAERKNYYAIKVRRINYIKPGKALKHLFQSDYQVRIFRKGCVEYKGVIHEQPYVKGKILILDERFFILHKAYNTYSLKAIKKLLLYAKLAGLMRGNKKVSTIFVLGLPLTTFGRLIKYLIVKKGILDGLAGLEATLVYILYLTLVDIFKAIRPARLDFVSQAISKGKDLNFLCKQVR
ncbi:MAG: glycosyltransferase family 2 protein [Candidatus Geothermarchaeota archaeon]